MKMIAAIPAALLTLGMLGCSQQASTASTPAVQHPGAGSSETNTFGENKEEATGSAANARAASFGGDSAPAATEPAPAAPSTDSTPPK